MSSLEIIKQELIKQKALLESKGFSVPIANRNPTPTEISNALSNINLKFSETTATEQDVRAGKTFISQTQGIRTGTLNTDGVDAVWEIVNKLVSGTGDGLDITTCISPSINRLRAYAFHGDDNINKNMFYATDFTIPSHIQYIEDRVFWNAKIYNKVTIPPTCLEIDQYCFGNCPVTEAVIDGGLWKGSLYIFYACNQLKKVTIGPHITTLPEFTVASCTVLEEIVIQTSQPTWVRNSIYNSSRVQRIIFETAQPCIVDNYGFYYVSKASIIVPYEYYDIYFNATNYHQYDNPMYGYGTFIVGNTLPATQGAYNLVWYASFNDLLAGTNPVTECSSEDRYYATFTEIEATSE